MGRTEKPLTGPTQRVELARYLRYARDAAGVTYEEMARHAVGSPATLKRTASGATVPKWQRVTEFLDALRSANRQSQYGIRTYARRRWMQARMEERGTLHLERPKPKSFVNHIDFRFGLYALYERAGAPPLHEVQEKGGAIYLPLTTLNRIVHQETLPVYRQQLSAFLHGCGMRWELGEKAWVEAYVRVTAPGADQEAGRQIVSVIRPAEIGSDFIALEWRDTAVNRGAATRRLYGGRVAAVPD
ncbi:helix-turn-helix domain-containing protein [Streptomyces sp. NPDC088180]|uniref:helix-turn-helix domain-containing protein n=1 Tax=Streptomyces sp. NPDC088180 TaxID=3365837 RepID=UPI00381BF7F5